MLPVALPLDDIPAGWQRIVWGEGQPGYQPLPAVVDLEDGQTLELWRFTDEERAAIAAGADLKVFVWTCGHGLQPHALVVQGTEQELPGPDGERTP